MLFYSSHKHSVISSKVPVFYVLMTAKCRTLSDAVFFQIRNNYRGFKPKKRVVDFETALYSSMTRQMSWHLLWVYVNVSRWRRKALYTNRINIIFTVA